LWERWAITTESNHDIDYKFENISETHTKITHIYKGRDIYKERGPDGELIYEIEPDIVGEPTYETRTDEGNRS